MISGVIKRLDLSTKPAVSRSGLLFCFTHGAVFVDMAYLENVRTWNLTRRKNRTATIHPIRKKCMRESSGFCLSVRDFEVVH